MTALHVRRRGARRRTLPGPADVASLHSWHNADSIVAADGSAVGAWADSSGSGRVADQPFGNKPTFRTGQINGKPVVRFASANALRVQLLSASQVPITIFAMIKPTATGGFQPVKGSDVGGLYFGLNGAKMSVVQSGVSVIGNGTADVPTGSYSIVAATLSSTAWAIYRNGAADGSGSHSTTLDANKVSYIGASNIFGDQPFVGDIAELVVYSSVLGSTDRATVTTYLGAKYGITVT